MANDIGILNKILSIPKNVKLSFIEKIGEIETFSYEAPFMDSEFIAEEIKRLQSTYKCNRDELGNLLNLDEKNADIQRRINDLHEQQLIIRNELSFLFSHNSNHIDECFELLENINSEFIICLSAMKLHLQGEEDLAYGKFVEYIQNIGGIPEHFLACKMFGELLIGRGQYKHAIPFLRNASEKNPDDIEVHNMLATCYQFENMQFELEVENKIIGLLTCDSIEFLEVRAELPRIRNQQLFALKEE